MAPPTIPAEHSVNDFANDVASQMEGFTQSQGIAEEAIARDREEETKTEARSYVSAHSPIQEARWKGQHEITSQMVSAECFDDVQEELQS